MNMRYHLDKKDRQSVFTTLQNNTNYYQESDIKSIKPGSHKGSRLEYTYRKNIPYIDNPLLDHVASSTTVKHLNKCFY